MTNLLFRCFENYYAVHNKDLEEKYLILHEENTSFEYYLNFPSV